MSVHEMRTAPGRGPNAGSIESRFEEPKHTQPETLSQLDADIETAEEYERHLARKAYRVRKLILDLRVKRDCLQDLSEAAWRGAAA